MMVPPPHLLLPPLNAPMKFPTVNGPLKRNSALMSIIEINAVIPVA